MTKKDVVKYCLMSSPKVVAEILYDVIQKYESRTCKNCKYFSNDGFGTCNVLSDSDFKYTPPDNFGCNQYKRKDND